MLASEEHAEGLKAVELGGEEGMGQPFSQDYMTIMPDLQGLRLMHIGRPAHTQLTMAVASCIPDSVRSSSRQELQPL